jgi:hypothetical protein
MIITLALILIIAIVAVISLLRKNEELKNALTNCRNLLKKGRRENP